MKIIINIVFLFVINLVATENVTKCIFTIQDDKLNIEINFNAIDVDSVIFSTTRWAGQKNYHTNIQDLLAYEGDNNRSIQVENIDKYSWVAHNKKKKFKLKYSVSSSKKTFMGNKTKKQFHPFTSKKLSFVWMNTAILFSDNKEINNNPVEYEIISKGKDYYANLDSNLENFNELRDLVIIAGELRYYKKKLDDNFIEFIINGDNWKFTDEDFISSLMKIFKAQINYMGINPAKTKTMVTLIEGKKNNFGGTVVNNTISLYPDPDIDISKDIALIQLVAHENFHLWNGQNLIKMDNKEFSEGYYKWFVEGFTDYYSLLTLLKKK